MKLFLKNYIFHSVPNYIFSVLNHSISDEFHYYITTSTKYLKNLMVFISLHHNLCNKVFSDLVVMDFLDKYYRFNLIYNVLSLSYHQRMFISVWTDELTSVPSLIDFFPSINWFEREAWDLFGVHFTNNYDLRRILTDYGFYGHPFRKDFPLSGFIELYYSNSVRLICYRKISLIQDYRNFDTLSPWNYFSSFFEQ
jgi:NADH:ubiquinone oxidoreductase subunit C